MLRIVTLPCIEGKYEIDAQLAFNAVKSAFLAEYADDSAVSSMIYRNGDIAERDFVNMIESIKPERSASATQATIEATVMAAARMALVTLCLSK